MPMESENRRVQSGVRVIQSCSNRPRSENSNVRNAFLKFAA